MEAHEVDTRNLHHVSKGKLIAILAIVAIVFAAAFVAKFIPQMRHERELREQATATENAPPVVNVALPQVQAHVEDLHLPADVRPMAQTAIYARVDGYIGHWFYDIGDHVDKGQLLALIDAPDTDAQLAEAQAALQQAKANVTKAEVNLQLATATYERYHGLLATGSVTQQDLDTRQTNANQAVSDKAAADAAVKSAQATVDRLAAQQGFEKITAPFSGTVTFRNYDVGARISATDTAAGHELFDIADTDHLRIYVSVPQAYVTLIQQDQPVGFISQRNYGMREFTGHVARTAGSLDPNTRTLLTELDFDNHDHLLWSGMYGEAHISVHRDHPMLTVPTAAMMFEADGTKLAVVGGDNKVHFKKVTVGEDLGQRLEVVAGLLNTEKVVTNPGEKLVDGATVEIAGQAAPAGGGALAEQDNTSPAPAPPKLEASGRPSMAQPTTRIAESDSDPAVPAVAGGSGR